MKAALAAPALGLPAALLAHSLVFGADHAVGGALQSAAFAAASLLFLCAALVHARQAMQGSVASRRIRDAVPALGLLLLSSGAWFGAIEMCEAPHAIPPVAVALALFVASIAICGAMRFFARVVARVVLAIRSFSPAVRKPLVRVIAETFTLAPSALSLSYRRFSRPPPVLS